MPWRSPQVVGQWPTDADDFRSRASAEAWIRGNLRSYVASGSGASSANVKTGHGDADLAD